MKNIKIKFSKKSQFPCLLLIIMLHPVRYKAYKPAYFDDCFYGFCWELLTFFFYYLYITFIHHVSFV